MITHSLHSAPTAERIHDEDERVNPATAGVGDAPRRKMFGKTRPCSLRYVSYSIPLACIMTLLFGLIYSTCFISDYNSVYAEESLSEPSSRSVATNPSASLTIGNDTAAQTANLSTVAAPGTTAYLAADINYYANNVENYALKISYAKGNSALVGESADATAISNITTPAGETGANLSDNSWGYSWNNDTTITEESYDNLTFLAMPAIANSTTIAHDTADISNGKGKLIFAAKFANGATTTNYKTSVLLSLATTPRAITYTINYDSNGGSSVASTTKTSTNSSETLTISATAPTKLNHDFVSWKDNNGRTYSPGENITLNYTSPTITLAATWIEKAYQYKIVYDMNAINPNNNVVIANPEAATHTSALTSHTFTVTEPTQESYFRSNGSGGSFQVYFFEGWSTNPTATTPTYSPGDSITVTSSNPTITLYGVWKGSNAGGSII